MTYFVKPSQIIYIENDGKKVMIHTSDRTISIYAPMVEMERRMGEQFF